MLEIEVGNVWIYLNGSAAFGIIDSVTSYDVEGRWFSAQYKRAQWDGKKRFREFDRSRGLYRIGTGFLSVICKALDTHDYPYVLFDERDFIPPDPVNQIGDFKIDEGKYDYQFHAVQAACLHGRGVIHAATGAGKSAIGAAIIKSFGTQTVWLTHRIALLHQTRAALQKFLEEPVGILGDGQRDIQNVTVAMVQTIDVTKKDQEGIREFLANCDVVIGDEIHHLESKQWGDTFSKIGAAHRFGLTATPCFKGPGMALIGMTGNVIYEIGPQELIRRGVLVPPRIWMIRSGEPKIPAGEKYPAVYSAGVVKADQRNGMAARVAKTLKDEGKSGLTLVRQINHGKILVERMRQAGVDAKFIQASVKPEQRDEWVAQMKEGEIDHIVAVSSIMGEGVDIPWLPALINATGSKGGGSKETGADHDIGRVTTQFLGRGLRCYPGKEFFEYFDFADTHHKFLAKATKDRVNTLEEHYAPQINYWSER